MRSRIPTAFAALAAAFLAQPPAASPAALIVYTMRTVERHDPACRVSTDRFSCTHIRFQYPVIEQAPRPAAADALNKRIRDFLLISIGEPHRYPSLEAAMDAFMRDYGHDKPPAGTPITYWDERAVSILYQSSPIVSIKSDLSFFTGGLHPQYAASFASYDATTGAKIRLDDVMVPGYGPRLTRIAENEFRAQRGIKPGMTLREAGYIFFKNDTFALNDNYWFGPYGLSFLYSPYEIAPYSMGTTELLVPYRRIRELIRLDGLLRSMR